MGAKSRLKALARTLGYDISVVAPNTDSWSRRAKLLSLAGVDLVLDVGAHEGGWADQIRSSGYKGLLVSLEPQSHCFSTLEINSRKDYDWHVSNLALSDHDGQIDFNVYSRSSSSSIFNATQLLASSAGFNRVTKTKVESLTLDTYLDKMNFEYQCAYLKCDVQGAEKLVLAGAQRCLDSMICVELELSLGSMYSGQWEFTDAISWFRQRGYKIWSIEPGFADPETGEIFQVDVIFVRSRITWRGE